jgi:hypothetical protein
VSGDGPDLQVEVVAGGRPDAAVVTAIGVAVRRISLRGEVAARRGTATSDWRRAALREGVGGRPEIRPDGRG